jgi:hypothetical protein
MHVVRIREREIDSEVYSGNLKGGDLLEYLCVDGKIINSTEQSNS